MPVRDHQATTCREGKVEYSLIVCEWLLEAGTVTGENDL